MLPTFRFPSMTATATVLDHCVFVLQVKWVNWMANISMPDIPPEMNFSDIIIPTMDLVRGSFLLETLLTNNKKVSISMYATVP